MTQLIVDASVAIRACGIEDGFAVLGRRTLSSPPLMWSEARSVIREMVWRREVDEEDGLLTYRRLATCPVRRVEHPGLHEEAWQVAAEMGWAKTYDAEYVALARLHGCRLVTLDARLRRAAGRLGFVIAPHELS